MNHKMMLSDLYGRIGQILREQGDAPIGCFKQPQLAKGESVIVGGDWISPTFVEPTIQTLEIGKMKIKCCFFEIYE